MLCGVKERERGRPFKPLFYIQTWVTFCQVHVDRCTESACSASPLRFLPHASPQKHVGSLKHGPSPPTSRASMSVSQTYLPLTYFFPLSHSPTSWVRIQHFYPNMAGDEVENDDIKRLIPIVNKLQDAFATMGSTPIDLPQIAVVGGQVTKIPMCSCLIFTSHLTLLSPFLHSNPVPVQSSHIPPISLLPPLLPPPPHPFSPPANLPCWKILLASPFSPVDPAS